MADNTPSTDTVTQALELADRTDILTEAVIGQVNEAIGERLAVEIAGLRVRELIPVLRERMAGVSNLQAIATALLGTLEALEYTEAVAAPAAAPLNMAVILPSKPGDMTLRELLEYLLAHPDQYGEIEPIVTQNPTVRRAAAKSPNWLVPVSNTDPTLDVAATVAYVTELAKPFTVPQRTLNTGIRPITLPRSFGRNELPLIHPFTFDGITGPDSLGFDWGTLGEELHKALLWAHATGHELWPAQPDLFTASTEVFTTPLPDRWQRILEDYQAMCADNPDNAVTSRYHTEESLALIQVVKGGGSPFGHAADVAHDDSWYRKQLEEVALSAINAGGTSVSKRDRVIMSVQAGSGSVSLHNVIVLGGVRTNSGSVSGTIYLPPGYNVRTGSGSDSSDTYNLPWEKLYRKAIELGII